jgi:hypothetical protein
MCLWTLFCFELNLCKYILIYGIQHEGTEIKNDQQEHIMAQARFERAPTLFFMSYPILQNLGASYVLLDLDLLQTRPV